MHPPNGLPGGGSSQPAAGQPVTGLCRWLVLGHSGAGKSTLAVDLGQSLGLPVIHLDKLSWRPGWQELDRTEFVQQMRDALGGDRWIIDGNYTGTLNMRLPRAQAVVWLDYSLPLCLWGVGRRIARWRGRVRPDMGEGCPERLDWEFIHWVITQHRRCRRRVAEALAGEATRISVFRFTRPRQTRSFLQAVRSSAPASRPAASGSFL